MRSKPFSLVLALSVLACASPALAQDKGTTNPKPLPPLANPADPRLPAKEVFGRALTPAEAQARSIGFYWRGCLAGAKALPVDGESWQVVRLSRNRMWGNPAMIAFLERFSRKAKARGRLERHSGRRHFPAARRPDADRPRLASGRPRRRRLAHPDARPYALARGAREHVGGQHGDRGRALRRQGALDAGTGGDHQGCGRGARGRAHLRQRRDQEGPVRDRPGPAVDEQGARLLGAQLSLPHPHQMPGGRHRLSAAGSAAARRRLRQVARLVVHRRGAASARRAAPQSRR